MLWKPAPLHGKFSSPMTNSSIERFSHVILSPGPPTRKTPLKNFAWFPIPNPTCKQWAKFTTCSSSPGDCGDGAVLKDMVTRLFDYPEQNGNLKILIRWLWQKMIVGGGQVALQSFWSLKKGIKTFNFRSNELTCNILGPLGRYDQNWKKKLAGIGDLSSCKNLKTPHFCRKELETSAIRFSDTLNLMVWFSLKFYDF